MNAYDHWLTTTPEDEADAAGAREARKECRDVAAENAYSTEQDGAIRVAIPDGYETYTDYACAENARISRLFGADWADGLPV